jgi:hypothetical protein
VFQRNGSILIALPQNDGNIDRPEGESPVRSDETEFLGEFMTTRSTDTRVGLWREALEGIRLLWQDGDVGQHSTLGRSTVKLRWTRSSSVATLTRLCTLRLGPGSPWTPSSFMIDQTSFLLTTMSCPRRRAAVTRSIRSAAGALMDLGHKVHEQQAPHLTIRRHVVLELVEDRACDAGDLARSML